jgi:gliding motility-associated-like protein
MSSRSPHLFILIALTLFYNVACAQTDTTFWFAAPDLQQAHGDRPIYLRISTLSSAASISISQPANASFIPITLNIGANSSNSLDLTSFITQLENVTPNAVANKGLLIRSTTPISCYYDIANGYNGDIYALKGNNALGTKFTLPFQMGFVGRGLPSYTTDFIILATENNTQVTITPKTNLMGHNAGVSFTVTLQKGETYTCSAASNNATERPGGTIVTSNKPICISTKDDSLFYPGQGCADTAGDQLIPDDIAGKDFVVIKGYFNSPDFYYVFAIENNTIINVNGASVATLQAGEYYKATLSDNSCFVNTDKPVHIFHITGFGCELGGAIIPSIKCTGSKSISITRASSTGSFYLNILAPKNIINDFTLNGTNTNINGNLFSPVTGSNGDWMFARLDLAASVITGGQNALIQNIKGKFHVGVIQGTSGSTGRYGYFSDFSSNVIQLLDGNKNVEIFTDNLPICYNTTASIKAVTQDASTYTWTGPNGFSSSGANLIINNFTNLNNGMYTITSATAECGVATKNIVLNSDQIFANFTSNQTGCIQDSVYFNTPVITGARWNWNFKNGTTLDTNSASIKPLKYNTAGTYAVDLRVTSKNGCISDIYTKNIEVTTKPNASFSTSTITCINKNIAFTDQSSIISGTLSKNYWNLDNGNGVIVSNSGIPQNSTYNNWGNRNPWLITEASSGCKSDTFKLVNPLFIHSVPTIKFSLPTVCLNDAIANFTDSTSSADGNINFLYEWNFNAGSPTITPGPNFTPAQLTAKNPAVKYNKAAVYSVSLKVTSNGCIDSLTSSFTVNGANPTPLFDILAPTTLCSNDSVRIKNLSVVDFGDVTRLEIYWDANDLTKKTIDETPYLGKVYAYRYPNFQTPATKNYTITLKAFSGNAASCSKSISKVAVVNQSPKVTFTTMPGICNEATTRQITQASFDNSVPGSFAYSGTAVSGAGVFNPVTAGVGTYPIKYVYTSSVIGCKDSASRSITVWPSPTAKWGAGLPSCEKNNLVFTDSSVANYSKVTAWAWDFGDGTVSTKTSGAVFSKVFDTSKTYTVSLKVTTDSGCVSVLNTQLVKVNPLPKPAFSLPSICLPDGKGTFINSSSISDGSEASFKYAWNFGNPNNSAGSTSKDPTHTYSAVGPVNVKLIVTTNSNCIDSLIRVLNTIYPQPKAAFTISPDSICMGDMVTFTDKSDGKTSPINKWVWDLGQSDASSVQNPNKRFRDSGIFTISLYGFNGQNCVSDTLTKTVTSFPYPHLNLGPDFKILEGGTSLIKPAFVFGNKLAYKWRPPLYLNSDTAATPRTTPLGDVTYTLELTGLGGCMVTDDIFIKLLLAPEVPNAFSPNGDGINDNWVIKYLNSYSDATIDVYNRYGQSVYKSIGYDNPWNGKYNGVVLPVATYYYIINPKNGRKIITGSVTIIK